MRPFEDFLAKKEVKRVSKDFNLAKNLLEQAERRLTKTDKEEITEENRDFILEDYYESLRTLADALLALKGYKTYSHEAPISYLSQYKEFSQYLIEGFDRLRRLRHGSRYYGERTLIEDAEESRKITHIIASKLKEKIQQEIETP